MENISFEDFKKLDIRVGEIITAEEIPGADRLYKVKVNIGEEDRELVAGIKAFYTVDSLIGKKIVVLTNLEPKVIRGVQSHGMLLAASLPDKSDLAILTIEKLLPSGSPVS